VAIRTGRAARADAALADVRQRLADAEKHLADALASRWTALHTNASRRVHEAVDALAAALGGYVEVLGRMPAGLVTGRAMREVDPARLLGLVLEVLSGSVPGVRPQRENGERLFDRARFGIGDVMALVGGRVARASGRVDLWPSAVAAELDAFDARERQRYEARHPGRAPKADPPPAESTPRAKGGAEGRDISSGRGTSSISRRRDEENASAA